MASAAPSFLSTKETTNYARLCRLLVDVGTQALRDTFDRIHPPTRLHGILASTSPAHPTLKSLQKRKILNVTQWGKLYPTIPSSVSSASFDITLLMVLLRNICGLGAPASTGSWDILPPASDKSIEANIARIKYYRNNVYSHATQASIDEPTFHALWLEISNALLALGSAASYTSAISRLKTECMDPDFEEHYRELLKEWKKDDDSTKEKLEQLEVGKKRKLCLAVPEDCYGMPPQLSVKPPKLNDLPNTSKPWRCADLPIDVLLLTVEDCEFLSCFSFLDQPFKSYNIEVGLIYFGYTGNAGDQKKLKVALMKCSKGAAVPGGSLTAVKNAVRALRPKAVFLVGTCRGLSSDKIKLGDVVVSSKLTTPAGFKTPVSRHLGNLVRHAHCGWIAPLENRDELEVKVHCDGDILSQTQVVKCGWDDLHFQYPEAIAVETEGEGVFAAAYDEKVEWVLVKGVASFVNQTQLSRGCEWMSFASTMAASVVANMLNDPVVFQEWPHCNQETLKTYGVPTQDKLKEIQVPQFSGRRSTRLSTSTAQKNVGAKGASRKRGATCTSEAINDTTVVKRKAAKPSIPVPAAPLVLKVIAHGIRKCAGCQNPIKKVILGYDAEQDRTMCFGRFETYTYWNKAEGSYKETKSPRHYHLNPVCTGVQNRAVNINVGVIKPDNNIRALLKERFNYNLP